MALKTETTSLDADADASVRISLAVAPNEAAYLPLGHREGAARAKAGCLPAKLCNGQIPERDALAALKPLLEDKAVVKVGARYET